MNNLIKKTEDGKFVFTGREVLPEKLPYRKQSSKLECPLCHQMFDYLVGETDTQTGERQGCELCYKPPTKLRQKGIPYEPTPESFD